MAVVWLCLLLAPVLLAVCVAWRGHRDARSRRRGDNLAAARPFAARWRWHRVGRVAIACTLPDSAAAARYRASAASAFRGLRRAYGAPQGRAIILLTPLIHAPVPLRGTLSRHRGRLIVSVATHAPGGALPPEEIAASLSALWPGLLLDPAAWADARLLGGTRAIVVPFRPTDCELLPRIGMTTWCEYRLPVAPDGEVTAPPALPIHPRHARAPH